MKKVALLLFFLSLTSQAAYRVFQLKIISYDEKNRPKKQNKVLTTLDPYQYENYHGGFGRMKVEMIDTWFCPGDTHAKTYCKKPIEKDLQRGPAGVFAPKRNEGAIRGAK